MKFGKLDIAAGIVIALAFFLGYFNLGLCAILVLIVLKLMTLPRRGRGTASAVDEAG